MPDDLNAELAKMKHDHRQHVSANFPAPGICVSRCSDSQPRWPCHAYRAVAALEAVLKLADEAKVMLSDAPADCTGNCWVDPCDCSGVKPPLAWNLNPAKVREAITRTLNGETGA